MVDSAPNELPETRTKLIAEAKEKIAKIIPEEIQYNISILFFEKTSCLVSVDASHSVRVEEILKKNFNFSIKYGKNRSPFLRLFIGNLKAETMEEPLK